MNISLLYIISDCWCYGVGCLLCRGGMTRLTFTPKVALTSAPVLHSRHMTGSEFEHPPQSPFVCNQLLLFGELEVDRKTRVHSFSWLQASQGRSSPASVLYPVEMWQLSVAFWESDRLESLWLSCSKPCKTMHSSSTVYLPKQQQLITYAVDARLKFTSCHVTGMQYRSTR